LEVARELRRAVEKAGRLGLTESQVIYDPGIGFGKTCAHNLQLLGEIDRLLELGRPVLIGASRKSFIAKVSPGAPGERLGGSLAAVAAAIRGGAAIVRVHDVAATVQYLRVDSAIHLAAARGG